jgi:four helix bundle suffix protein
VAEEEGCLMSTHSSALRPHGGYRRLRSFQVAETVYDGTVAFCERFVDKRSRTRDQMVQAARSGRQNIAEGSRASATSSQTELRLVNVARASLDELLLDYEDFLRQRGLPLWGKDDSRALQVRGMRADQPDRTDGSAATPYEPYRPLIEKGDAETAANTLICLIHQANFLLDRQIRGLERQFVEEGGYSERLAAARLEERKKQGVPQRTDRSDPTDRPEETPAAPACPVCGKPMVLRTARKGPRAGSQFWGCSGYPTCTATKPV